MSHHWLSRAASFRGRVLVLAVAGGLLLHLPSSAAGLPSDRPGNELLSFQTCGAELNPTGNPIGGGSGYSHIVDPSEANYVVANKADLLHALDEAQANARDSWGDNNGMVNGATWVDGKAGKALHFDGTDDYVDAGRHPSLTITGAMTTEMWVKLDALKVDELLLDNDLFRLFHRGEWAGDRIYFLYRIGEAAASGDSAWDHWAGVRTETELLPGQWYHIVGVKDGNRMRIYLNGVLEKELDCLSGYTVDGSQASRLHLGQSPFNGILDEVKIYSKALTASEVQQSYSGASAVTDGLVSWWRFEEDPATSPKTIYVADDAEIDLTGEQGIPIPSQVTLASGRGRNGSLGGLIYVDSRSEVMPLLRTSGPGVRLTGLRLRGPDPEIGDHGYEADSILSRGFESNYPVEVDNCELWGWSHAAILVREGSTNAYIHHNSIHHNRAAGLGYGVCLGYSTENEPISVLIEANLFDFCRHHVASTGNAHSSYEARYNIALEHANSSVFDRHGTAVPGSWVGGDAGDWTIVHHNTVRVTDQYAVGIRGKPLQGVEIHDNWFYHPDPDSAIWLYTPTNVSIGDNFYGVTPPAGTALPLAKAIALPAFGKAPLTVSFDGSGSLDPDGALVAYQWDFGDGNTARGMQVTHTFTSIGTYNVTLTVSDNNGIPARTRLPVAVAPASATHVLDFWVEDSYRGALAGTYRKQVLIDGAVVWEDDVAGDEGWTHVVTDVTGQVAGKAEATLTLRTTCDKSVIDPSKEIIELSVYWDDVNLAGGSISNGSMESSGSWTYSAADGSPWEGWYASGDVRSGDQAYVLHHPYRTNSTAGSWAKIEQVVRISPAALRGQWRFEQVAGSLTPDASMYGNHGTMVNMGAGSLVDGIIGRALRFDGVDDYMEVGNDASLRSPLGTIELWIKPQAAGQLDILRLLEDDDTSSLSIARDSSNHIHVLVHDDGLTRVDVTSAAEVSGTGYHHLAIAQDGSGVKVFVDGQESHATGTNSAYWSNHLTPCRLELGRGPQGTFNGILDDVAIYSRALTGDEIRQHHDQGYPHGQWRLDDGAGNRAMDSSTYGNHGMLVNMDDSNWVDGVSEKALWFDGVDDYVDLGNDQSLSPAGTLTIEMWGRFDAFTTHEDLLSNNLYSIYHRGDWAGDRVYFLYRIKEAAASGDSAWDNWAGVSTQTELIPGRWYHIVGVKDGNRMSIYLNGVLEKSLDCLSGYSGDSSQTGHLHLGPNFFHGALDEVALYARVLTADEVWQHYSHLVVPPSNLSATVVSRTQIRLAWTDNSINEDGFKVERSADGVGGWVEIAAVGVSITSYTDSGLAYGTPYTYRVRARNGGGYSGYSNTAEATTSAGPRRPRIRLPRASPPA